MNLQEVKKKAISMNIKPGRMKKVDLIKAIQKAEGNPECYSHEPYGCNEFGCCFRDDCLNICQKK